MRKVDIANEILISNVAQLLKEGHTITMRVRGNSMRPFLESHRDKVVLAPIKKLNVKDLVLAEISDSIYVIHRIIKIEGSRLTLMGDGNLKGTESCKISNVIAIVTSLIRNEKPIICDSFKWKTLSFFWLSLKPVRRWLLAIYRRII